jgi:hypothetical protein
MLSSTLEQRLLVLESIEAIRNLRCRYHELVNEDAGPRLYGLFAPEATINYGGRGDVKGRESIREFFAAFPVKWARQFVHNHVVQTDGHTGTGYAYLDGRPIKDGKSFYVVGRFDDEYVRMDGTWYFQRVVLTVHYMIEPSEGWADRLPVRREIGAAP